MEQFFGRTMWTGLLGIFGFYVMGAVGFSTELSGILLALTTLFMAGISWKHLDHGISLAFLELFSNPHGILVSHEVFGVNVSLRMAIFAGVMLGWVGALLTKNARLNFKHPAWNIFVPLLGAVIIGWCVGLVRRSTGEVFSDGNAYLYLAYLLPILSIQWTGTAKSALLQVLTAGALWNAGLSFVLLFMFTHLQGDILSLTYTFFRDLRVAEITLLDSGAYRIFIQSQLFTIIFGFFLAAMVWVKKDLWKVLILGGLVYATVALGLSRSFWVGLVPTILFALVILYVQHKPTIKTGVKYIAAHSASMVIGMAMILTVALLPMPGLTISGGDLLDSFTERTSEEEDVAISSRWNLLGPMGEAIQEQPLLGHGFGKAITYITDDPRAREINPSGEWTVVAMEWGWLELWIKMGALGVIGFLYAGYMLIKHLWAYQKTEYAWLGLALSSMIMFIFATHMFSPYLNHPIGLGILLFVLPFLPKKKQAESVSTVSQSVVTSPKATAAVMTSTSS